MDAAATALCWVAAGLLVAAGVAKLRVPDAAMTTLHALRLPSGRFAARVLGVGEVAAAAFVVVVGGRAAAAVLAATYGALLAVLEGRRRRQASCGCFGGADGPVTWRHLAVDAGAVAAGLLGLLAPPAPVADVAVVAGAVGTAAAVVLAATATVLVRAVAASGPQHRLRTTAWRPSSSRPSPSRHRRGVRRRVAGVAPASSGKR